MVISAPADLCVENNEIFERWDTRFDIDLLREHLTKHVFPLSPICQSESFGGWSVLSRTGSYKDGWQMGHVVLSPNMTEAKLFSEVGKVGIVSQQDFIKPTEICFGYMSEVIDFLNRSGLSPARARIIRLSPNSSSSWHRDSPENWPRPASGGDS